MSNALVLRCSSPDGTSYKGFQWPLEVGAVVEAPDWNPLPICGGGLHGWLWGEGNAGASKYHSDLDAIWHLIEAVEDDVIDLQGKVKFRRGTIVAVGKREEVIAVLQADPRAAGKAVIYGRATAGYRGTATAGDEGTAAVGDGGTASAGYKGSAKAGHGGTATAGYRGTATAGDEGTAAVGDKGTALAGYKGTATAGDYGTATAGDGGSVKAGHGGTATAGYRGTATAGDQGTASAGLGGSATAGTYGTASAGLNGTASAGFCGIIMIQRYSEFRKRIAIGYIGENGLKPNTPYNLDDEGNFVEVVCSESTCRS
jgi:hypothetical protein